MLGRPQASTSPNMIPVHVEPVTVAVARRRGQRDFEESSVPWHSGASDCKSESIGSCLLLLTYCILSTSKVTQLEKQLLHINQANFRAY